MALVHEKCFNHRGREAVARCLQCGRFFCRECVTEHGDRVVCAECLRTAARRVEERRARWQGVRLVTAGLAGLVLAWMVFYAVGRVLVLLPAEFHEGTLWSRASGEPED